MTSLIDRLARKPTEKPSPRRLAPEIEPRLRAAEQHLDGLEAQLGDARLDAELGKPDAGINLAALTKQLGAAKDDLLGLREAFRRASERDQRADADARARLQGSQFAAMQAHARASFEAMVELSAAAEAAAKAYRRFVDARAKMIAAVPIGAALPPGVTLDAGEALVAGELYRHSGVTEPGQRGMFPGAKAPSFDVWAQPHLIPPAVDTIKQQNEHVLSHIKGQLGAQS